MSKNNFPVPNFSVLAKNIIQDLFIIAEKETVGFFKESFDKQGFTDTSFQKWEDRKSPDYRPGGAILNASGTLKDSIEVADKTQTSITIGSYAPYAKIHNEGGMLNIPITPKSRKYFWYMYKQTKDEKWKWMALSKKNHTIVRMPKRQFIGESATLMKLLDTELKKQIVKRFKEMSNQ